MRTELFEPEAFRKKALNVLVDSEAPLRGFIFPIEFEGQCWERGESQSLFLVN